MASQNDNHVRPIQLDAVFIDQQAALDETHYALCLTNREAFAVCFMADRCALKNAPTFS